MSRADQQFKLRMPASVRAQLEQAVKQARRSLNAEIVIRLEANFAQGEPKQEASL
ncbi:Arc family DNA-binding protein [Pseudomonas sp. LPB0260]|uniref:Arc family DNA-binding protein n=1 Tax=Pseudomonas sp. LPB0260 TaxID=2614442 RepID=UPI0015C27EA8|nr:Arc family DNA-binding protein [Pseudomonas sp. LPB0260]QLC73842.1 Arc family DNA-binding protein [Pseudomonas sp. LPB0260]QLC76616.1 Arc family DNA-binding protein [Pseudomonas sp. LPB0260]